MGSIYAWKAMSSISILMALSACSDSKSGGSTLAKADIQDARMLFVTSEDIKGSLASDGSDLKPSTLYKLNADGVAQEVLYYDEHGKTQKTDRYPKEILSVDSRLFIFVGSDQTVQALPKSDGAILPVLLEQGEKLKWIQKDFSATDESKSFLALTDDSVLKRFSLQGDSFSATQLSIDGDVVEDFTNDLAGNVVYRSAGGSFLRNSAGAFSKVSASEFWTSSTGKIYTQSGDTAGTRLISDLIANRVIYDEGNSWERLFLWKATDQVYTDIRVDRLYATRSGAIPFCATSDVLASFCGGSDLGVQLPSSALPEDAVAALNAGAWDGFTLKYEALDNTIRGKVHPSAKVNLYGFTGGWIDHKFYHKLTPRTSNAVGLYRPFLCQIEGFMVEFIEIDGQKFINLFSEDDFTPVPYRFSGSSQASCMGNSVFATDAGGAAYKFNVQSKTTEDISIAGVLDYSIILGGSDEMMLLQGRTSAGEGFFGTYDSTGKLNVLGKIKSGSLLTKAFAD